MWLAIVFGPRGRGVDDGLPAELLREPAIMGTHLLLTCSNLMPGCWRADTPDLGSDGNNKGDQLVALVFCD